jgi:hypothetical protein
MKQNELLEKIPPLLPIDFFSVGCDLEYLKDPTRPLKKNHLLPDTSELLGEEAFASFFLGWNEEGIFAQADIDAPFENCYFPQFRDGDSLELFIDTRDLKTAGFVTRFCHHFVFLPKAIEEIRSQEITHFRLEDSHPLADSHLLKSEAEFHSKKYTLKVFIPSDCLHGYDPQTFNRLGFTYRINRVGNMPQHFSVSSNNFAIEKHPSLWASFKLIK